MAGMRPPRRAGAASAPDRGQLLLAGAFVVAVTLIALTLVLSASNYTATLSDQDDLVTRGGDAITVREAVEHDLERRFAYVVANYDAEDDRRSQFRWTVENMSTPIQERHSRRGRYVNVTQEPYDEKFIEGTRLSYLPDESGGTGTIFKRPNSPTLSPDTKWEMATDVQVRNFTLVVTDTKSTPDFTLTFQNSDGGNWSFVVRQGAGNTWVYEIRSPSGYTQTCRRDDPAGSEGHLLDFQDGTITLVKDSGNPDSLEPCPALTAIDLDGQHYDINITGGDGASGRYSLIVDEPPDSDRVNDEYFNTGVANAEETLYGARVNYQYYSPTVTYNATIEVAPEEFE